MITPSRMCRLLLVPALLLAQQVLANDFSFSQSRMKLSLPGDFVLVPRAEIEQIYSPGRGPGFLLGNTSRSITISNDLKDHDLTGVNLSMALPVFSKVFEERVPGLVWKDKKVIEAEKQQWLQLEFVSKSYGVDYYNIMLITPVGGKTLVLNFNSTLAEFATAQPLLREAIKSVALNIEVPELIKGAGNAVKKPARAKQ